MRALAALCLLTVAAAARAEPDGVDWQRRVVRSAGGVHIEVEAPLDGGLPVALLPAGDGAPSRQEE